MALEQDGFHDRVLVSGRVVKVLTVLGQAPRIWPSYSMAVERREITILFSEEQWMALNGAADRLAMTTDIFIKNAALHFTVDPVSKRPRKGQLNSIHSEGASRGHTWTEAELRERHLPLYWCEEWVRARLAEGYNVKGLALLSGFSHHTVSNYLRTHFEINFRESIDQEAIKEIRKKVAAGERREAVAAQYGITLQAVIPYCKDLPDGRTNNFMAKAGKVRMWPATTREIADSLFDGESNRASAWCRDMVKSGRLQRVDVGLYAIALEKKAASNE